MPFFSTFFAVFLPLFSKKFLPFLVLFSYYNFARLGPVLNGAKFIIFSLFYVKIAPLRTGPKRAKTKNAPQGTGPIGAT